MSKIKLLGDYIQEGKDAYKAGESAGVNPYLHGTAPYWNWLYGWEEAEKQANYEDECPWFPGPTDK